MAQMVKNLPTMKETQIQSLGQEHLLEKGMATHSSILAWRISWTEEPGSLQSMGSQRVGHNWATNTHAHTHTHTHTHTLTHSLTHTVTSVSIFPSWGSIKPSRSPLNHQSSLVTFETFPCPRMQGSFKLEIQWLLRQAGDLGIFGVA